MIGSARLSAQEWLRLARPFSLTAAAVPVLVGSALAQHFHPLPFVAMLLASMLIQAATNMFNEYYDAVRGLDQPGSIGISGSIVEGRVAPRVVLGAALTCYTIAALLSLYLVWEGGILVLTLGLLSALLGYIYNGGPRPIAYTAWGEFTVFWAMGPLIVLLSEVLQNHRPEAQAILIGLPIGCLVAAILLANNLRDLDKDRQGGRQTLAIRMGRAAANQLFRGLLWGSYLLVILLVLLKEAPWTSLLVVLSLPLSLRLHRLVAQGQDPRFLNQAVRGTAQLHLRFGLLLVVGLLLGRLIG
jgi:1,4-dihydroxy-2-naphthoate octaprenyltransferase